jgi:predicted metal-dependent HD superfamily phosphohydrolase
MINYQTHLFKNETFKKAFKYLIENNKSWNNPYHNNKHILNVFESAITISLHYELNKYNTTNLGVAAIFHDINHSGGKLKDNENIAIAIKDLIKFNKQYDLDLDIDEISDLISYTEFPDRKRPSTISQKILMDADMLSIFTYKDWFNDVIFALSKEFNNDIVTQIDQQLKFHDNLVYFTDYGQAEQKINNNRIVSELRYLKTILQ